MMKVKVSKAVRAVIVVKIINSILVRKSKGLNNGTKNI